MLDSKELLHSYFNYILKRNLWQMFLLQICKKNIFEQRIRQWLYKLFPGNIYKNTLKSVNMVKMNNKDTRATSMTSFSCLCYWLWTGKCFLCSLKMMFKPISDEKVLWIFCCSYSKLWVCLCELCPAMILLVLGKLRNILMTGYFNIGIDNADNKKGHKYLFLWFYWFSLSQI